MKKGRGATQKPQRDSVLLGGAAVAIAVDVGCCPAGQSWYGWKIGDGESAITGTKFLSSNM